MSHLLEFPAVSPFQQGSSSPPYAIFGIYGSDITSSLPPRIPLRLVLHFAPALQAWVLPAPDPTYLPHAVARQSLRTPYIGIDIQAPIDAVGLGWIILRMLHVSGSRVPIDTFDLHPNLATCIAIHNAWLALKLPIEGLRGLQTHIYSQLIFTSPPVSIWDMRMLWDAFPADSQIITAMGLNFIRGHVDMEYSASQSLEIIAWFQSTPERYALFNSLRYAMPEVPEPAMETITIPAAEVKEKTTGYRTIGKRTGKTVRAVVAKEDTIEIRGVGIMERDATRKVSPQERQDREDSDFEALRRRLRRTRSDDSLRSVDTAIWTPQPPEEWTGEEEVPVNDDMDEKSNYSDGDISTELARTLESIRLRREARNAKHKRSPSFTAHTLATEDLKLRGEENEAAFKPHSLRHRRSSSTNTTGKEHSLSIANLQRRIQALKIKQSNLTHEGRIVTPTHSNEDAFEESTTFVNVEQQGQLLGTAQAKPAVKYT